MKNFQVKNGQCDSIIFSETFSLGSSYYLLDLPLDESRTPLIGPRIYPQIYRRIPCPEDLFARESNKQQRKREIISNFTKEEKIFVFHNNHVLL